MKTLLCVLLLGFVMFALTVGAASAQSDLVRLPNHNPKPINLDFEEGTVGEIPAGWSSRTQKVGYIAELSETNPKSGKRSAVVRSAPDADIAPGAFGNLMQAIDATPYRGHIVRFRAAARMQSGEEGAREQLWMRVDRLGKKRGFFDNMMDRPIYSDQWNYFDVVGLVDDDAETLSVGVILYGKGSAWIDDVTITNLGSPVTTVEPARPLTKRKLENVVAFTRLLGYIRHFYPSDEAFGANWNAIAIDGMRVIENADEPSALAKQLEAIFTPVAPDLRVFATRSPIDVASAFSPPSNYRDLKIISYRHFGFGQAKPDSPYHTERVVQNVSEVAAKDDAIKLQRFFHSDLGGGVSCVFPLALFSDKTGTLPHGSYKRDRDHELLVTYTANDRATRLADVALTWNIFQHFFPYFDLVKIDWNRELRNSLTAATTDVSDLAFLATMQMMIAKLHDGHGGVYTPRDPAQYMLPVLFDTIEGHVVVLNTLGDIPNGPKAGDVVVSIDGKPVGEAVADVERKISGATPQWIRWRAMQNLRLGPEGSPVKLEIRTGSEKPRTVVLQHEEKAQKISETRPPMIDEIRPGIFYVDLSRISDGDFNTALPKLTAAKGIVFDLRGYPRVSPAVIQHLIDKPVESARWNVPIITEPDRAGKIEYDTNGRWNLAPEAPKLTAKIAFMTDGRAISYAESYMGIIEAYKIAAIVGETTAGTNGDVNPFTLSGGYTVYWTGMKVLKNDGSRHHGIGIKPTIPVSRTIAGIASGRDEQLEAAIAAVSK